MAGSALLSLFPWNCEKGSTFLAACDRIILISSIGGFPAKGRRKRPEGMDRRMESGFLRFMNKRVSLLGVLDCRVVDLFFFAFVTFVSALLRVSLRETVSGDYTYFLKPWYDQIKELGWASLGENIGNYSPLYMYLFTAVTFLPLDSLSAVKGLTLVFDYVTAALFFGMVYRFSHSFFKATVAWGGVLFLPSVVLNGAVWAQCDIIYTLFLLLSFDLVSRDRPVAGCVAFGVSFCFKLQSVFFLPILLIYWLKGKIRFYDLFPCPRLLPDQRGARPAGGTQSGGCADDLFPAGGHLYRRADLQFPQHLPFGGQRLSPIHGNRGGAVDPGAAGLSVLFRVPVPLPADL